MLTKKQGQQLINLARLSINSNFGRLNDLAIDMQDREFLEKKQGVFVTLTKKGNLRGCIGFTEPDFPLGVSVLRAARSAAFEDPRFKPVEVDELSDLKIEITVLTLPREIKVESQEDLDKIEIGQDGLIIQYKTKEGLLLPQVATEYNWTAEEFLEQTCLKAGLKKNAWLEPGTKIYKFQGQVFSE